MTRKQTVLLVTTVIVVVALVYAHKQGMIKFPGGN
jgi:hypothetical protein